MLVIVQHGNCYEGWEGEVWSRVGLNSLPFRRLLGHSGALLIEPQLASQLLFLAPGFFLP
jgi:hypothetical protein